ETIGPVRLSVTSVFNPLQVLWACAAIWAVLAWRPRLRTVGNGGVAIWRPLVAMAAVSLAAAAPIVLNGLRIVARGDYLTQEVHWRSGPRGADLATLALGNVFHPLWGDGVQRMYQALGIDVIESGAWLGAAPLLL